MTSVREGLSPRAGRAYLYWGTISRRSLSLVVDDSGAHPAVKGLSWKEVELLTLRWTTYLYTLYL